jgi:hypothetical protein
MGESIVTDRGRFVDIAMAASASTGKFYGGSKRRMGLSGIGHWKPTKKLARNITQRAAASLSSPEQLQCSRHFIDGATTASKIPTRV